MIYCETIELIHSNIINSGVYSVEELDYRVLEAEIRVTEDGLRRETENNDLRLIE